MRFWKKKIQGHANSSPIHSEWIETQGIVIAVI